MPTQQVLGFNITLNGQTEALNALQQINIKLAALNAQNKDLTKTSSDLAKSVGLQNEQYKTSAKNLAELQAQIENLSAEQSGLTKEIDNALDAFNSTSDGIAVMKVQLDNLSPSLTNHQDAVSELSSGLDEFQNKIIGSAGDMLTSKEAYKSIGKSITDFIGLTGEATEGTEVLATGVLAAGGGLEIAFGVAAMLGVTEGLKWLVGKLQDTGDAAKQVTEPLSKYDLALDKANKKIGEQAANLEVLVGIASDEKRSYGERKQAIDQINESYPELNNQISLYNVNTKAGKKLIDDYIESLEKQARAQAGISILKDQETALFGLIQQREKLQKSLDETIDLSPQLKNDDVGLKPNEIADLRIQIRQHDSYVASLKSQIDTTNGQIDAQKGVINSTKELIEQNISLPPSIKKSTAAISTNTDTVNESGQSWDMWQWIVTNAIDMATEAQKQYAAEMELEKQHQQEYNESSREELAQTQADTQTYFDDQRSQLAEAYLTKTEFHGQQIKSEKDYNKALTQINKDELDKQLLDLEDYAQSVPGLESTIAAARKAIRESDLEDLRAKKEQEMTILRDSYNAASQLSNSLFDVAKARADASTKAELDALEKKKKNGTITEQQYEKEKEAINKKEFEKDKKLKKEQLAIQFAMSTAEIWLQALIQPESVATFGATGVAAAAIMTAIAAAQYGAQLAIINSQQFALGGKVQHLRAGHIAARTNIPQLTNGDNVLATVRTGEVILNHRQQALLGGAPVFRSIGVPGFAGGGLITPTPVFKSLPNMSVNLNTGDFSKIVSQLQNQRVYVLESDITSTQNRVSVLESQTSFGL